MSRRRSVKPRMGLETLKVLTLPLVGVVVVALGIVVGPATPAPTGPRQVDIAASVAACPIGGGLTASAGQVDAGTSSEVSTTTGEDTARTDLDPDVWTPAAATGDSATVRQDGTGGGVAYAAGRLASGNGLVVSACPRVTDETWYLGAGTTARHASSLVLTNVADVVGSVDVELWGPAGPIDAVGETGIVVEPGETRTVSISDLAVGADEVALRVVRTRGAVTSALVDTSTSVLAGSEVLPSTGEPATETVLPGVAASGTRTLLLANPGSTAATASVRQAGAESDFVPEGLDAVAVPAGSVVSVPLPAASGVDATAFRISSDRPVLSTVRVTASAQDFAYATSSPAWTGPVVVPVDTGAGPLRPVLQLLADDATAQVTVEAFDASMTSVGSTTVEVGSTVLGQVDLADPAAFGSPEIAYVVLSADEPVHGTAVYRVENLLSLLGLEEAPVDALGPDVRPGF
ncbi:DUF5719 family protein [Aeromicrobium sp. Leaf350]|uniref:DUF5719 family protein n=1 Tax=Aeromicrobium sp. Leaf350 TaxID=2876565 RepID=UPI001E51C468|nr:DUF5719 family protein [Aeromicrobium sp. Leaf350]